LQGHQTDNKSIAIADTAQTGRE